VVKSLYKFNYILLFEQRTQRHSYLKTLHQTDLSEVSMKIISHIWTKNTSFPKITGISKGGQAVYNLEE